MWQRDWVKCEGFEEGLKEGDEGSGWMGCLPLTLELF